MGHDDFKADAPSAYSGHLEYDPVARDHRELRPLDHEANYEDGVKMHGDAQHKLVQLDH